jgi:hypothetical protein
VRGTSPHHIVIPDAPASPPMKRRTGAIRDPLRNLFGVEGCAPHPSVSSPANAGHPGRVAPPLMKKPPMELPGKPRPVRHGRPTSRPSSRSPAAPTVIPGDPAKRIRAKQGREGDPGGAAAPHSPNKPPMDSHGDAESRRCRTTSPHCHPGRARLAPHEAKNRRDPGPTQKSVWCRRMCPASLGVIARKRVAPAYERATQVVLLHL